MRVLVVGTGSIGRRHIDVIKAAGGHEIAICEVNKANADETGEMYGIKEVYYDLSKALKADIDVAIVCTPNAYHADATVKALKAGCHVLVEKPIANTLDDARSMVEAEKKSGKKLMVGYTLRVYPGLAEIKKILDSGRLGKPISTRVNLCAAITLVLQKSDYRKSYETGGGIIYDYSHEIDYLRFLFGEIKRYACFVDLQVKEGLACDDVAEMILQYENGVMASLHMDYILDGGRVVDIICEKGRINYNFNGELRIEETDGETQEIRLKFARNDMFLKQFERFVDVCSGKDVSYVTGEDGLKVLEICENLYAANKNNLVGQNA